MKGMGCLRALFVYSTALRRLVKKSRVSSAVNHLKHWYFRRNLYQLTPPPRELTYDAAIPNGRSFRCNLALSVGLALSLYTPHCFAYLDPGSGNALICLILSLAGAAVYFVKSLFYRLIGFFTGKKVNRQTEVVPDLVIFSEGKTYFLTFKGIIEELIARKIHFTYLSMDVLDPALEIDSEYMHSKYVGEGAIGFSRIEQCAGRILLATTPNIGCPGYPLRRPRGIRLMVHVCHSVCDLTYLKVGSLDHYDVSFDLGPWMEPRTRIVEKKRNLTPHRCFPIGLPYMDELIREHQQVKARVSEREQDEDKEAPKPCILIAPSWGAKNSLKIFGSKFIDELLRLNYQVILRPHPQSFKFDEKFYEELRERLNKAPNFHYDTAISGTESMSKADLLISDVSGFRFDFAFIYGKPVLTLKVPAQDLSSFEASVIGSVWEEAYEGRLGAVLTQKHGGDILTYVEKLLKQDFSESDRALYDELIFNHGTSAKAAVDQLIDLNRTL